METDINLHCSGLKLDSLTVNLSEDQVRYLLRCISEEEPSIYMEYVSDPMIAKFHGDKKSKKFFNIKFKRGESL